MKKRFLNFGLTWLFILCSFWSFSQPWVETKIRNDVYMLASDSFQGRLVGSEGEKMAAAYIAQRFEEMRLEPLYGRSDYYFPFSHQQKKFDGNDSVSLDIKGLNVVGFIDNRAEHTIVIGAHYDHLGFGEFGNSKATHKENLPHYGADDNASGVAGVLALAHYFSVQREIGYNYIFVCFSGEEIGLIGSKSFVNNDLENKESISFMINFDMIGRFSDDEKLMVFGVGTADEWNTLLDKTNKQGFNFNLVKDSSGIGPSDHTSFYLAKIPVLYFHTGAHSDYHKPTDTPDRINYKGLNRIVNFVEELVEGAYLNNIRKPIFRETKNTLVSRPKFNVTLGIMPDYSWQQGGIKIDGVIDDKPAQKAGLLDGDIILEIGEFKIHSMKEYMQVLSHYHKGDTVKIVFLRGLEKISLELAF